jgi:hypothetical protein
MGVFILTFLVFLELCWLCVRHCDMSSCFRIPLRILADLGFVLWVALCGGLGVLEGLCRGLPTQVVAWGGASVDSTPNIPPGCCDSMCMCWVLGLNLLGVGFYVGRSVVRCRCWIVGSGDWV